MLLGNAARHGSVGGEPDNRSSFITAGPAQRALVEPCVLDRRVDAQR
jgi:hypothetical protein